MIRSRSHEVLASAVIALVTFLLSVGSAIAQSDQAVADFYRGKQVRFITAYSAGGLFDNTTRLFARYLVKYIPGNPTVWADNMPGAGGLIATNYLYNSATRDGTVMLTLDGALLRLQALGNPGAKFDARHFNWLPSPGVDIQVCDASKASGWTSIAEAIGSKKELRLGGLAPGVFPSDNARILQAALPGINIKLVEGYKGINEVYLAAESREVDGTCGSYESVKRAHRKELDSGDVRVIAQVGEKPWPGLEHVPNALDLAKTAKGKQLLRVGIIGPNDINRIFALPPGVPPERVEALRRAFDQTFNDTGLQADIEKANMVLRRIPVERIKEVALLWLDMPESEKKELQEILKIK